MDIKIDSAKEKVPAIRTGDTLPSWREVTASTLSRIPANRKIAMGVGADRVTFVVMTDNFKNVSGARDILRAMYDVARKINGLMPESPIRVITLSDDYPEYYGVTGQVVNIKFSPDANGIFEFSKESCVKSLCHEMAHAVFDNYTEYNNKIAKIGRDAVPAEYADIDRVLEDWNRVFNFAFVDNKVKLVDDSNYVKGASDHVGHPEDNTTEFFASSVAAYVLSPQQLIEKINDPATSIESRAGGTLIFCYLRDEIFSGRVFSRSDPFRDRKIGDLLSKLDESTVRKGSEQYYNDIVGPQLKDQSISKEKPFNK